MKKRCSWLLLLLLLCPTILPAAEFSVESAKKVAWFCGKLAVYIGMYYGSSVAHELGHGIAANLLWNSPIAITIGSSNYLGEGVHFDPRLLNLMFGPMAANFLEIDLSSKPKLEQLLVYSAGPVAGFISLIAMYYLSKKFIPEHFSLHKGVSDSVDKFSTIFFCYTHLSEFIIMPQKMLSQMVLE